MKRVLSFAVAAILLGAVPVRTAAQEVDLKRVEALKWRLIGPWRGGRSVACAGSQARPKEYYFGATGGGLWKTTDGGDTWDCVSDGFFRTASVGAVAVSPSNPDIVYAGGGERDVRGNVSHGDGIYKTTDGGKTWTHVGLAETQTTARIAVHPTNPDVVYVAALGHVYGPNKERGVYKTTDGGKSWRLVLFESDRAGAVHLVMDPGDPETLYAATWEMNRTAYSLTSGGKGSKLWKTTDGGKTWKDLSRNPGLPKGLLGKIGVSVSGADSKRVWAIVEAEDGGVFLSDDAGTTWKLVTDNRNYRQRAWYYTHVYADPKERDTVYILNVGAYRSTDAGKTWQGLSTPHSDNHDLWIAPDDPKRMINSNDGGANVSTDGGRTWTEQDIPTGQFYHVTTDSAFPYRVYGAQQDNSTVRIASRSSRGRITAEDWTGTAGGESGYVAVKPDDPDVVFGGNYSGVLEMTNHRTGESRDVNPWPDNPMGHGAGDSRHRMQWTFPILFSPHNPNRMYACSQHVLMSDNLGQTWKAISPDLTRNDPKTLGPSGGPITKDNTGVEYYGTVFTFAESPVLPGVLWAGSDDGLIHASRDGGATWTNVTPKGMPKWALVSILEASPHDPAVAYAAVDNHENDDQAPYLYRTFDYGASWQRVVSGFPANDFLRVVREDPVRRGMLYAGTETALYVSFDYGDHWQSLRRNLPVTPVHDLTIKEDDLVIATHGRGFWIMDDVTPLRALQVGDAGPALFGPKDAYRVAFGGGFGGGRRRSTGPVAPSGENPTSGVVTTFYLDKDAQKVTLEFTDPWGETFQTQTGPTRAGSHRIATTLRYPSFRNLPGMIFWAAGPRPIPAPPGEYTVTLKVDDRTFASRFRLRNDPRGSATEADTVAQFLFARRIAKRTDDANTAVADIRAIRSQIEAAIAKHGDLRGEGEALKARLDAIEEAIYQVRNRSGQDPLNYPIRLNNKIAALLGTVLTGDFRPTDQSYEVFAMLSSQLQARLDELGGLMAREGAAFSKRLTAKGLPGLDPKRREPASGGGPAPELGDGGGGQVAFGNGSVEPVGRVAVP